MTTSAPSLALVPPTAGATETSRPHRFRLAAKRDLLAADLAARRPALSTLPRRTRLFVRLPNWLGDVVIALPLLRALRQSAPDAEITLIAAPALIPLLRDWQIARPSRTPPAPRIGYLLHFWRLRSRSPDVILLFTNSLRGDLEALADPQPPALRTDSAPAAPARSSATTRVARRFRRTHPSSNSSCGTTSSAHFGLNVPPDRSPLPTRPAQHRPPPQAPSA